MQGNAFFEATPEGGKSDKTFCVTLDNGKQVYCYVGNDKLTFYKANLDGGIFSAHSMENKKRKKAKAKVQEQKKQQTGNQKLERRILTLPKAPHKNAPVVVEITKKLIFLSFTIKTEKIHKAFFYLFYKENFIIQFRLLDNKARPKWEISRWTDNPEKTRASKETLGSFPCHYSMVPHSILDKCTKQEKAEVLEWWRVTSEAMNRERVRSQVTKLPVIFKDLAELRNHAYALKHAVSKAVRRKLRQQKNQEAISEHFLDRKL